LARKKLGTTYSTTVSSHKRKIGKGRGALGRFITRKTNVATYTRQAKYWGKIEPIKKRFLIKYERRFTMLAGIPPADFRIPPKYESFFPGNLAQKKLKLKEIYSKVEKAVSAGIDQGIKMYENAGAKGIAQRTGKLRADVIGTLYDHRKTFPITVYIGAPHTKYASFINKVTPNEVQLSHSPGKQQSGVTTSHPYDAKKGDPDAQYQFFGKAVMQVRNHIQEQVLDYANSIGIPYGIFLMFVKITNNLTVITDE